MPSPLESDREAIKRAARALDEGRLVAMPTETVYGLAARIDRLHAIERIFIVKGRPSFDPLIVHVANIEQAKGLCTSWPRSAEILAREFWPGPLTLVLPKSDLVSDLISAGLQTVGVRIPNHPVALALLAETQVPLAAPSANLFGRISPTTCEHVRTEFLDVVNSGELTLLDGGACSIGVESTVVLCEEPKLTVLRPGGVTKSELETALQSAGLKIPVLVAQENSKAASPGHTEHHYMPTRPLTVFWGSREEILLDRQSVKSDVEIIDLPIDPRLAARELYASLRAADLCYGKTQILLYREIRSEEMWEAIDDRLIRAAVQKIGKPPR